jgi:hypothetical protein
MYYKSRLPSIDDNPPVLSGVIVFFDNARGTGSIREISSGSVYKFRDDDAISSNLYPESKVLFCVNKSGNAIRIKKIIRH